MDRKIKRNEYNDKKMDYKIKDSGDMKKPNISEAYNMKVKRGDSGDRADSEERKILLINKKSGQMKLNMDRTKTTKQDSNYKYLIIEAEKDTPRKNKDKDSFAKSYPEIRKRIRDKYTFKYNVPVNKSEHLSLYKSSKGGKVILNRDGNNPVTIRVPTDPAKTPTKPLPEETRINEKQIRPSLGQTDLDKKLDYIIPEIKPEKIPVKPIRPPRWNINSPKKRRPMIQTVVSKTDAAKIFKAVKFVDNINSTPLEIKIPGENIEIKKQQKVSKYTETTPLKLKSKSNLPTVRTIKSKPSKENIKIEEKQVVVRKKPVERKRGRKFRQSSPDASALEADCPKTEVARWVPASVDPQTKPYYEAWVDTTLTATNIPTKKEKSMYEYQLRLLQSFRRAMAERPQSPDLFYEKFKDERYAGRIKIKQTDRRGNT